VVGHFYFRGKCERQPTARNLGKVQGRSAQGNDIQPVSNPGHLVRCELSEAAQLHRIPLMMNTKRCSQILQQLIRISYISGIQAGIGEGL
jgi:hypothetical protein